MNKLVNQEQALVNQLTPAQQTMVGPGSPGTSSPVKYTGPTSTPGREGSRVRLRQDRLPVRVRRHRSVHQWLRLLRADHVRLGGGWRLDPAYQLGAVGQLPHVSTADLQPGDILVFNGAGHVGIYVGNNQLIDAPQTGRTSSLSLLAAGIARFTTVLSGRSAEDCASTPAGYDLSSSPMLASFA